jgi:hypothetical protein
MFWVLYEFDKLHLLTICSENIENHNREMMSNLASSTLSKTPGNTNEEDDHPQRDETMVSIELLILFADGYFRLYASHYIFMCETINIQ